MQESEEKAHEASLVGSDALLSSVFSALDVPPSMLMIYVVGAVLYTLVRARMQFSHMVLGLERAEKAGENRRPPRCCW